MKVYRPGTRIFLHDLEAVITAVNIRDGIQYEASWVHSGQHKSEWVEPCEIEVRDGDKASAVGFKP